LSERFSVSRGPQLNFDVGTDANVDQILAQLRVSQAQSQLPADVNNYGVAVQKSTTAHSSGRSQPGKKPMK